MKKPKPGQIWRNASVSIYIESVESIDDYTEILFVALEDKDDMSAPGHSLGLDEWKKFVKKNALRPD